MEIFKDRRRDDEVAVLVTFRPSVLVACPEQWPILSTSDEIVRNPSADHQGRTYNTPSKAFIAGE